MFKVIYFIVVCKFLFFVRKDFLLVLFILVDDFLIFLIKLVIELLIIVIGE